MRWIVIAWLVFITALSIAPLAVKTQLGTTGPYHNLGHLSAFFIATILLCSMAPKPISRFIRYLAACCFGVFLEWLETAFYHDGMEWRDVTIHVLGATIGLAVVSVLPFVRSGFQKSEVSPEG
jgi:hypothetical protein